MDVQQHVTAPTCCPPMVGTQWASQHCTNCRVCPVHRAPRCPHRIAPSRCGPQPTRTTPRHPHPTVHRYPHCLRCGTRTAFPQSQATHCGTPTMTHTPPQSDALPRTPPECDPTNPMIRTQAPQRSDPGTHAPPPTGFQCRVLCVTFCEPSSCGGSLYRASPGRETETCMCFMIARGR